MKDLLEGFRRFRGEAFPRHQETFHQLAVFGQSPKALVLSCCDSRVDPQMIFSAGPGDLFVIRNVANLVPPYAPNADYHGTSAALEFGVRRLNVQAVVVLGHTQCGGIRALLEEKEAEGTDFVGPWMKIAAPVRSRVMPPDGEVTEDTRRHAEREVIRTSLDNLMTFPWIRERVEARTLGLYGCVFDVSQGDLLCLDHMGGDFRSVLHSHDVVWSGRCCSHE